MKKTAVVLVLIIIAATMNRALPQTSDTLIKITIKNQFSFPVRFYINGTFITRVEGRYPYSVQIRTKGGPLKLEAWSDDNARTIAARTFETYTPGKSIVWETGKEESVAPSAPAAVQARSGGNPADSMSPQYPGRSAEEVYVAVKMALEDCRYEVKTSEKESGLVYAEGKPDLASGKTAARATVMVYTDPSGNPGVKIQVLRPSQTGDSSETEKKSAEEILAALRNILR